MIWAKISIPVIRHGRAERVKTGREASEVEALAEVSMLQACGEWAGVSFNAEAKILGWSRTKLRNALKRWRAAGYLHHEERQLENRVENKVEPATDGNVDDQKTSGGQVKDPRGRARARSSSRRDSEGEGAVPVWGSIVAANRKAGGRDLTLTKKRRKALRDHMEGRGLCEAHTPDQILSAWQWILTSDDRRASFIRNQSGPSIDTLLRTQNGGKLSEYVEAAAANPAGAEIDGLFSKYLHPEGETA